MKYLLMCLALLFSLPGSAAASPDVGGAKFTTADINKDGFLTREEFFAAFPGLKPQAFGAIDTNGDDRIAAKEWQAFSSGHSSSASMTGHPPQTPVPAAPDAKGDALPLLPIPGTPPAPAVRGTENLPLLSPPGK